MAIPRLPGSPNSGNDKPKSVSDKAISPSPVAMPEPPAAMPDMPEPANDMPPMPDYIPEDPDEIPSLEDAPEMLGAPDEPDMPELDIPAYQEPEPFDPRAETEPASDDNMLSFQDLLDLEDKPWWQQPAQVQEPQPGEMTTADILGQIPQDHSFWSDIIQAVTPLFMQGGRQESGAGFLPLGDFTMPDGTKDTGIGLPQPLLDAFRSMMYGLGMEQDPNAPEGYVSEDAMLKGAMGGAGGAITGSLGAGAARAMRGGLPRNTVSSGGAGGQGIDQLISQFKGFVGNRASQEEIKALAKTVKRRADAEAIVKAFAPGDRGIPKGISVQDYITNTVTNFQRFAHQDAMMEALRK